MENKNKEIKDDEFRVLGTGSPVPLGDPDEDRRRRRQGGLVALAIVALLGLGMIVFWPKDKGLAGEPEDDEIGVFESEFELNEVELLGTEDKAISYAERIDTVVAGHPLTLFIPHHATPVLRVGQPDDRTLQSVMGFQAADIRADNYEILGDFVLAGEQLAKGTSKKGFCAIVDGKITVGVGENTPLLGETMSKGGYFFRQYALVDNSAPVENKPKNKTVRKALCSRRGQVFVAFGVLDETLTDFARALADFGVDNAIYLVGSAATFGWATDSEGNQEQFGSWDRRPEYKNESYVIWVGSDE